MRVTALGVVVLGCFMLSACTEKPQTLSARKADTPVYGGTTESQLADGWKPGDAASWEQQMRNRAQGQNEYTRASVP